MTFEIRFYVVLCKFHYYKAIQNRNVYPTFNEKDIAKVEITVST